MKGVIRNLLASVFVCVNLLTLLAPIVVYKYSLSLVQPTLMPRSELNEKEALASWSANEKCTPEQCRAITPYWYYRWFVGAILNDQFRFDTHDWIHGNTSTLAHQVALHHMRSGHFKGKGMFWWHLSSAALAIHIQRNWSVVEIVTYYQKIDT